MAVKSSVNVRAKRKCFSNLHLQKAKVSSESFYFSEKNKEPHHHAVRVYGSENSAVRDDKSG